MTDDEESGVTLESRVRKLPYFLVTMVVLDGVGFTLGSLLFPPDPYSQLLVAGPTLVVAPLAAYWFVYREGWRRVRRQA